jgi:hypothetical protein
VLLFLEQAHPKAIGQALNSSAGVVTITRPNLF